MLIEATGQFHRDNVVRSYSFGADEHLISGFFYVPGYRAGEESARYVQEALEKTGAVPFEDFRGNYVYCIRQGNGRQFLFPSCSLMSCLYVSAHAASSGFAEHLRFLNSQGVYLTFQTDALCEYYTLGAVYFEKTMVEQVSLLPNDYYVLFENGRMEILPKHTLGMDGENHLNDPQKFFAQLAYAVSGERVAQAVTGGYDSRMVFVQLNSRMELTPFISTTHPKNGEYLISQKVAEAAGKKLLVIDQPVPVVELTEETIRQALDEMDWDQPFNLSSFSLLFFNHTLQKQGFTLSFNGDGGVLHKDWDWTQDFPFYHRRHTNLKKYYHQRIAYLPERSNVGPLLKETSLHLEERMIRQLQLYVHSINTQNYDIFYYYGYGNHSRLYKQSFPNYQGYAPLRELELVRYSYHLPRRKRFFYNFMRKMTTVACPAAARIPTCYGTTASSEPLYLFRDIFFQMIDYGKKAIRLLSRILLHKNILVRDDNESGLTKEDLLRLPLAGRAVSWAVDVGMLVPDAEAKDLSAGLLARIIHTYLLAETFQVSVERPLANES